LWRADIADVADGPREPAGTGCGRAVDKPETGSALVAGHSPRPGFLRAPQLTSPFGLLLDCAGDAGTVELGDACEERDEEECDL